MKPKLFYYQDQLGSTPLGVTSARVGLQDESALIERIILAYQKSSAEFEGAGGIVWDGIRQRSQDLHEALTLGDAKRVVFYLQNPHLNNLLYGFEMIFEECVKSFNANPELGMRSGAWAHDSLVRLAEIVGALPTYLPEVEFQRRDLQPNLIIDAIESCLGYAVIFPNIFPDEYGVATNRGVASHRAVQALYQAWRVKQLMSYAGSASAIEIGAGLGRTAYYSAAFGIENYTIVDLPLANVAQAYFLGSTLGADRIILNGEPSRDAAIKIVTPEWFWSSSKHYGVAMNADSMTEMGVETATRYWRNISRRADVFISINHEAQSFRVADLPRLAGDASPNVFLRFPYALRKGYLEEIALLRSGIIKGPLV